jgi:hypothetical protein
MQEQKETRDCHIHGTTLGKHESCPKCLDDFENRPDAEQMTGNQRADEMKRLDGPMEIPFSNVHQRIEELVGRPVWTHEIGLNWQGLVDEAANRSHPSMTEIIDLIPADKQVIII